MRQLLVVVLVLVGTWAAGVEVSITYMAVRSRLSLQLYSLNYIKRVHCAALPCDPFAA
jgi:hypothetical protein